jgi:uncharacterized protein YndB with AHSA1/START domain
VAPIVNSVEISRPPQDVFAYVTDPSQLPNWQESVVSVRWDAGTPVAAGSRVVHTRRVGRIERTMTAEVAELTPPKSWAIRGVDGPVRGTMNGTIEPIGGGTGSRVTMALDFEGHGIGKLLIPLVVRRQARSEMPKNQQRLKERLEATPA